jgi:capsular exopolysaccharide synthesis family protein
MKHQSSNTSLVPELPAGQLVLTSGTPPWMQAAGSFGPEPEPEQSTVPLSHYVYLFRRHRWKILGWVLACTLATWMVSSRIQPIFESTATVDIDRQTPQGVIGQESVRSAVNDSDQFLATQIRLIQSDSVLRPVAERFRLLEHEGQAAQARGPGSVSRGEAPVLLKSLRISRPPNTYLLLISYRSTDPHLAAQVANNIAQSYLEHTYNIRIRASSSLSSFMEKQLDELRAKMERSSMALNQFERELNVINPEEKTSILSARLLQLNTEYTNAQSDRVRRQAVRDSVQQGSAEALETSQQGEDLRRLNDRLSEALEKFAQVRSHYGANHPEFRRAAAQVAELQSTGDKLRQSVAGRVEIEYQQAVARERMLQKAVGETKSESDRLNARSFEYQALKREADADKRLYEELVRKIKEAGINAGFQNSSVRLADSARPAVDPVFPNTKLNILIAFLLSVVIGLAASILTDMLDNTLRDPEQVSRSLNTEVIGTLPAVKNWRGRVGAFAIAGVESSEAGALTPVAAAASESAVTSFEEAVRTLRNSILLSDVDRRLRSILVTSASPSEGKSTTGAHLAVTHAEQGRKTLLIDGDLRKPSVHKRFNLSPAKGLSNVLTAECEWRSLLVSPDNLPDLHILPAGPPSRRAADLMARGLEDVLEEASAEYDLVVLDGPPLLGFAEPLQMATIVDGVIIVTRAGETSRKAVGNVLSTLRRVRANILGIVLNDVRKEFSDSYYYYGYYNKYYTTAKGA